MRELGVDELSEFSILTSRSGSSAELADSLPGALCDGRTVGSAIISPVGGERVVRRGGKGSLIDVIFVEPIEGRDCTDISTSPDPIFEESALIMTWKSVGIYFACYLRSFCCVGTYVIRIGRFRRNSRSSSSNDGLCLMLLNLLVLLLILQMQRLPVTFWA